MCIRDRFVVLHHSILSEGINVNGLEAVLFMRSMDYIGISQTIGRVIRRAMQTKYLVLYVYQYIQMLVLLPQERLKQ